MGNICLLPNLFKFVCFCLIAVAKTTRTVYIKTEENGWPCSWFQRKMWMVWELSPIHRSQAALACPVWATVWGCSGRVALQASVCHWGRFWGFIALLHFQFTVQCLGWTCECSASCPSQGLPLTTMPLHHHDGLLSQTPSQDKLFCKSLFFPLVIEHSNREVYNTKHF